MVSVCMITYNHEKYISQAIESILTQKVNFPIELVIGEDNSSDNTRKICILYYEKYPDIIKLRLSDKNLGMMPNFIENLKACKGNYIALLEGDDYWTDPLKLQKQVDFLELNPDYVMCCHNVKIEKNNGEIEYISDKLKVKKETYTMEDLCSDMSIHTSSLLYRNNLLKEFPDMLYKCTIGDFALRILIAEHGKTKYMDEVMSAYRIHSGGIFSGAGLRYAENVISTLGLLDTYYKGKYRAYFYPKDKMLVLYWDAFIYYCQSRHFRKIFYYAFKLFTTLKFSTKNPYKVTRIGIIKQLIFVFAKSKNKTFRLQ